MLNLTPELILKARGTKSAEELLAVAKENGIELTADEAKKYFDQLCANSAVSDDELDLVAGGCGGDGEEDDDGEAAKKVTNGIVNCSRCGSMARRGTICTICRLPVY